MIEFEVLRQCVQRQQWDFQNTLGPEKKQFIDVSSSLNLQIKGTPFSKLRGYQPLKYHDQQSTNLQTDPQSIFIISQTQDEYRIGHPVSSKISHSSNQNSSIMDDSCSQSQESFAIKGKSKKNKKISKQKKEPYPTKNFLPSFRGSFLNYLKQFFDPVQFEKIEIVWRIRNKKGINLQDYQDLFSVSLFKPYLKQYFRTKVIYRDLMISRIQQQVKRQYLLRVHVFEEAFRSGVFLKIN